MGKDWLARVLPGPESTVGTLIAAGAGDSMSAGSSVSGPAGCCTLPAGGITRFELAARVRSV